VAASRKTPKVCTLLDDGERFVKKNGNVEGDVNIVSFPD
jgi:hypothetical protein